MTELPTLPIILTSRGGILYDDKLSRRNKPKAPAFLPITDGYATIPRINGSSVEFDDRICVTFYVHSAPAVEGKPPPETGSGTIDDPWVNLNTVFTNSLIRCYTSTCTPIYVKVIVTGTVNYSISGRGTDFLQKLIIKFETPHTFDYNEDDQFYSAWAYLVGLVGVIFDGYEFHTNFAVNEEGYYIYYKFYCFDNCRNFTFFRSSMDINIRNGSLEQKANQDLRVVGFNRCNDTQILNSNITINGETAQFFDAGNGSANYLNYPGVDTRCIALDCCKRPIIINSHIFVTSKATLEDNNPEVETRNDTHATAYGIYAYDSYRGTGAVIKDSTIHCSAEAFSSPRFPHSYAHCAVNDSNVLYSNCSFSPSFIFEYDQNDRSNLGFDCEA